GSWLPQASFEHLDLMRLPIHKPLDFEVHIDGLRYCCKFRPEPESDFLNVSLSSYVPGESAPAFLRTDRELGGHFLAISDPTLLLVPDLRIGAFIGTHDKDA